MVIMDNGDNGDNGGNGDGDGDGLGDPYPFWLKCMVDYSPGPLSSQNSDVVDSPRCYDIRGSYLIVGQFLILLFSKSSVCHNWHSQQKL